MSNRERWVVYPLIFFSFLLAARDKFIPPEKLTCNEVTCNRLTIVASDGKPAVRVTSTEDDAGMIAVYACRLDPRLPGAAPADRRVRRRPLGHQALQLSANQDGGFVRVMGTRLGSDLYVGHNADAQFSGYAAVDENGEYLKPESNRSGEHSAPPIWGLTRAWEPPGPEDEAPPPASEDDGPA